MSIISFASCTNDIENLDIIPTNNGQNTEGNIILQERNPNLPLPLIKKFILNKPQTRNSVSGEDRTFLGYSYKIKNGDYIQGSINSLGFPIIDIDSIRKYRPSYLQEKLITVTETNIFTYNNLDKYLYDSRFGKKVSSEFTFNPKVFATEKKEAITKLFGNIEKATYGKLEVSFLKGQSTLNHLPSSRLWYISQFQNHIFTNILYNAPMASILNEFGEFILTDYFTGGKVYALFASKAKEGTTAQQKEDDMYTSINTSVINLNNATSINLGFNGSNFDATKTFKSTDTYLDMKTFGGEVSQSVAINTKVSNINIDLTPWRYSLKDMANNTMIDIADNSLYPLSAFVLEQNFKQRLDDTFNEILPANKELVPPRIEIVRVLARTTPSNEALYDVAAVLVTRQTDRIILSDAMASSATDEELRKIMSDCDTPVLVAADDKDRVLGYAFCIFQQHRDSHILTDIKTLYIDDLCVDEGQRGNGVGKVIYDAVVRLAKEQGCYNVTLNVWCCNEPAMAFYEKCGLKPQKVGMEIIL